MEHRPPFYGSTLRTFRNYRGLTLDEIGTQLGVSKQYVRQIEVGSRTPNAIMAEALADVLGIQPALLARHVDSLDESEYHFRRRRSATVKAKSRVRAFAAVLDLVLTELDRRVTLPPVLVPQTRQPEDRAGIERLAEETRRNLGLSTTAPIGNLTKTFEAAGVITASFGSTAEKVDAFSWVNVRPVAVRVDPSGQITRGRFSLAHEVAHISMHDGVPTGDAETEAAADAWASAFLMPQAGFSREFPRNRQFNWDGLIRLKRRWNVSLQAMIRRAYDLKLVSAQQYRTGFIQISKRGWRKCEPGEPADRERPSLLQRCFDLLAQSGLSGEEFAEQIGLTPESLSMATGCTLSPQTPQLADVVPLRPLWRSTQ